jgi:hypothetical protein
VLVIWTGKPVSIGCSFLFLFRSWATAIASARQGRHAYGSVGKTRRAPSTGVFPASVSRSMRGWQWRSTAEIYQDAYLAPLYPDSEI